MPSKHDWRRVSRGIKTLPAWKTLQIQIAKLFTGLGCDARVDAKVRGARASHSLDVWVTFNLFGQRVGWVIECKRWKRSIPKERVLTLQQIVADLGADRGILVSDKGFQRSAKLAASKSNVILTTTEGLLRGAEESLQARKLEALDQAVFDLEERLSQFRTTQGELPGTLVTEVRRDIDGETYYRVFGNLAVMATGLRRARSGRFPTVVSLVGPGDRPQVAQNLTQFVEFALAVVSDVERRVQSWERV